MYGSDDALPVAVCVRQGASNVLGRPCCLGLLIQRRSTGPTNRCCCPLPASAAFACSPLALHAPVVSLFVCSVRSSAAGGRRLFPAAHLFAFLFAEGFRFLHAVISLIRSSASKDALVGCAANGGASSWVSFMSLSLEPREGE